MPTSFNIFIGVRGPAKPGSIESKSRDLQSRVRILLRNAAKHGAQGAETGRAGLIQLGMTLLNALSFLLFTFYFRLSFVPLAARRIPCTAPL